MKANRDHRLSTGWFVTSFGKLLLVLCLVFLIQRLYHLVIIPVFADEAIYIYWSQLAASDWSRYAFMSMNDGKTPLIIWLMIPLVKLFADPLWAGRFLSVCFGLGQMIMTMVIVSIFARERRYILLAGLLVLFSPGLMLNHRLALMDTASGFFVLVTFLCTMLATRTFVAYLQCPTPPYSYWRFLVIVAGVAFGLALWTKFSNVLILPVLATLLLYNFSGNEAESTRWYWLSWRELWLHLLVIGMVVLLGGGMFALLRLSPSFPGIFSRGGDFLYSLQDFTAQPVAIIVTNLRLSGRVLGNYCGVILLLSALILAGYRWLVFRDTPGGMLLLSGLAYILPIICLGKLVYPRYFVPVIPFVIMSVVVSLRNCRGWRWLSLKGALILIFVATGLYYSWGLHHAPSSVALLPEDREQLFLEWSAGYGIRDTVALLEKAAADEKLLVYTEGHVGTLPDGLQIYLWQSPLRNNITVQGLGAPPVRGYESVDENWENYDQVYLVVNSHRLELDEATTSGMLVAEFPRPQREAPTLQVYRLQ